MALNFTTGIPEIDRLTENKIGNGSFLLLSGNDDEGISSFSAEIEKSNGRTAEKEIFEKNGCIFLKIMPENRHNWKEICSRIYENKKTALKINHSEKQNKRTDDAEKALEAIIFIESLSELFQNETVLETDNVSCAGQRTVSYLKEIKTTV
ncbi:MAG: hypothetical protein LBU81_01975, partial [Methanosarcinales archaeon]|nr:hypothetical protein [Methanosarcinales archaeon]